MSIEQRLKTAGFTTDTLKPLVKTDQGQIWLIESPGGQPAIDLWHKLRSQVHITMRTPIVIGDTSEMDRWNEMREFNDAQTVEGILREAAMNDGKDVLDRLAAAQLEDRDEEAAEWDRVGQWPPDAQPTTANAFSSVVDITTRKPLESVTIALIPTIASWMAPAYLKFGGWNDCPSPEDQVSVLKYWTRLYATDVFSITSDVVECLVSNPPTANDTAMALAKEQYAYCYDIVEQGTETIANLAGGLLNGRSWFFWWD